MPRAPKSSHARPLLPAIVELWSQLLARATTFRDLAPWEWLDGGKLLGVKDPVSGEIDWCSVMGQKREVFGVAIYPGDTGLRSMQGMLANGQDEFDAVLQQTAWVLTFNDRQGLTMDMAAVLKACGLRYHGADAWPELLDHDPGYFPTPPRDIVTLQRMQATLACLHPLCLHARKYAGRDRMEGQDRAWVAETGVDGAMSVDRHAVPVIPLLPLPVVALDEVAVSRVTGLHRCSKVPVMIDWFPGEAVIDGPEANGRPYYAMHLMAFDLATGQILSVEIGRFTTVWSDVSQLLLKLYARIGIPTQTCVRRSEAVTILGPLARALGTEIKIVRDAPDLIRQFRDSLLKFMR